VTTTFVIDPAVRNYAGHHFTAAAGWAEAAQAQGLDVRILAHTECVAETADTVPVEKIFRGSFYGVAPEDPKEAWTRLRIMQRNFRDDLIKPLMHVQPRDVAILSHSTLVTLNGLAAWASVMPEQRLPRLMTWLMMSPRLRGPLWIDRLPCLGAGPASRSVWRSAFACRLHAGNQPAMGGTQLWSGSSPAVYGPSTGA
jgi:hypothetical protein